MQLSFWYAAAVSSAAGVLHASRHGAFDVLGPAVLTSVLVPIVFPRVTDKLRRMLTTERWEGESPRTEPPSAEEGSIAALLGSLTRKNERLTQELSELRAAYAELAREAAKRTAAADRLEHLAFHDPLTQLPNRALLTERLREALDETHRSGRGVLVAYVDLDHFKAINDTLGHAAGDRVLRVVAARIARCLRATDTVSRVGGDEFIVVRPTPSVATPDDAAQLHARLSAAFREPIDIGPTRVTAGASIGVIPCPADETDPSALLERADQAMYASKSRRRSNEANRRRAAEFDLPVSTID